MAQGASAAIGIETSIQQPGPPGKSLGHDAPHAQLELRWFWSITMIGARHAGIQTHGHAATLEQAKPKLHTK